MRTDIIPPVGIRTACRPAGGRAHSRQAAIRRSCASRSSHPGSRTAPGAGSDRPRTPGAPEAPEEPEEPESPGRSPNNSPWITPPSSRTTPPRSPPRASRAPYLPNRAPADSGAGAAAGVAADQAQLPSAGRPRLPPLAPHDLLADGGLLPPACVVRPIGEA